MRTLLLSGLVTLVLMAAAPSVHADEDGPGSLYARALMLENGEGKTEAALDLYQRIWKKHRSNRVFASRALYRMGLCYRRLGKRDAARECFGHLRAKYRDQEEVADLAARALESLGERHAERSRESEAKDREAVRAAEEREVKQAARLDQEIVELRERGVPAELARTYARLKIDADVLEEKLALRYRQLEARMKNASPRMLGEHKAEGLIQECHELGRRLLNSYEERKRLYGPAIELHMYAKKLREAGKADALREVDEKLSRVMRTLEEKLTESIRRHDGAMNALVKFLNKWLPGRFEDQRERTIHHEEDDQADKKRDPDAQIARLRKIGVPGEIAHEWVRLKTLHGDTERELDARLVQLRERLEREQPETRERAMARAKSLGGSLLEIIAHRRKLVGPLVELHGWASRLRKEGAEKKLHEAEQKIEAALNELREQGGEAKIKHAEAHRLMDRFFAEWMGEREAERGPEAERRERGELDEHLEALAEKLKQQRLPEDLRELRMALERETFSLRRMNGHFEKLMSLLERQDAARKHFGAIKELLGALGTNTEKRIGLAEELIGWIRHMRERDEMNEEKYGEVRKKVYRAIEELGTKRARWLRHLDEIGNVLGKLRAGHEREAEREHVAKRERGEEGRDHAGAVRKLGDHVERLQQRLEKALERIERLEKALERRGRERERERY